jgi:hypothetical protein
MGHPDCLGEDGRLNDPQGLRSSRLHQGDDALPSRRLADREGPLHPNDGHVGAFSFGKVTGIAIGIAAGIEVPFSEVSPAKWKKDLQIPAAKDAAVYRASQIFPRCTGGWKRVMDHGRAEAALIALFNGINLGLKPSKPFELGLINGA